MEELDTKVEVAEDKQEVARLKAALDKATKEAADYKKALRQKQSDEEAAAEEKRIADEARDKELLDLRKRIEVAEISKSVMGFVGEETTANEIAESLFGAANAKTVVEALNKAWGAKEKALKLEWQKIGTPGVGSTEGVTITKEQLDSMTYKERAEFANKNPDEYNKLMGR